MHLMRAFMAESTEGLESFPIEDYTTVFVPQSSLHFLC